VAWFDEIDERNSVRQVVRIVKKQPTNGNSLRPAKVPSGVSARAAKPVTGNGRKQNMTENDYALLAALLENTNIPLPLKAPDGVGELDGTEETLLTQVQAEYPDAESDVYLTTSLPRYRHYLSIAKQLPRGTRVLEVGSAPGHISICLHKLGLDLVCINLNREWRQLYPGDWAQRLNIMEHDIEKADLPFEDEAFGALFFTEVLEHIAVRDPRQLMKEFHRVLVPGGPLILSTPNVCNLTNIVALLHGENVFWELDKFYGSTDRHNREFTPQEVRDVVQAGGFHEIALYGINCPSNWNCRKASYASQVVAKFGDDSPLLRNTIMVIARK
jgi:2-polyprenyl-3-methyl-5-hydroxy-6-metoxy-1,4-benzoquinol methylase